MRAYRTLAVTAALALSACASSQRSVDVRLPQAFEAPQDANATAVSLDRWWLAFDDPQLTGLVEGALARNPDAKSAAARLAEARAARTGTLLGFLPQGELTASGRKTHTEQLSGTVINGIPGFSTSGDSEAYAANFNVSWEIDLFGRIFAAARAGNADVAAARFGYEEVRAALAAQTADAYFQARGLAIQLADARETAHIRREVYDITTKRAQRGLAATSDADRVAGDLAQADAQAAALEAELQAERRTLLILAGRTVEPTANITITPAVGQAPPIPPSVPSQLLLRRPDVRQAQAQLTGQLGRVDVARLAFFPTFTLTPGLGWSKQIQPGFSAETQNWSIGGNVSQPILNIPALLQQLKAQNARADQAAAAYEKAVQTAFSESEGALVRLAADKQRVAILTDGEARAHRANDAARIGYDRGFTDLQTLLDVEQNWRTVRAQLTAAQVQALRRTIQAYQALGGGWSGAVSTPSPQAR
jgi:NodT family efflux transporter outer membrane factor (OMF) lipoprotein